MHRNRTNQRPTRSDELILAGRSFEPGTRTDVDIPISRLCTGAEVNMPLVVLQGAQPGPRLWLSAAVHGDEINGTAIIHHVLRKISPDRLTGSLIAAPTVNVFGFLFRSRYLPDGKDLNRFFPGSASGSLATQLARTFMRHVVKHCDYGIDLHTGAQTRRNLPHIRADLHDDETRRLAEAFGAPIALNGEDRHGSLRTSAVKQRKKVLLYEAGEPLRFNRDAIALGTDGVLRVLGALQMWNDSDVPPPPKFRQLGKCQWIRAEETGILELDTRLGARVKRDQSVGRIVNVRGDLVCPIKAPMSGRVIGVVRNPLIIAGDAIIHLGRQMSSKRQVH